MLNVSNMFKGCSMLESVDFSAIPDVELAAGDELGMFEGCSKVLVTCSDDNVANFEAIGYDDNDCIAWFVAPHSFYEWTTETDTADLWFGKPVLVRTSGFKAVTNGPNPPCGYFKNYLFDETHGAVPPISPFEDEREEWAIRNLFEYFAAPVLDIRGLSANNCKAIGGLFWNVSQTTAINAPNMSFPDCTRVYSWFSSSDGAFPPYWIDVSEGTFNSACTFAIAPKWSKIPTSWEDNFSATIDVSDSPKAFRDSVYAGGGENRYYQYGGDHDNNYVSTYYRGYDFCDLKCRWDFLQELKAGNVSEMPKYTGPLRDSISHDTMFYMVDCSKFPTDFKFPDYGPIATEFGGVFRQAILPKTFRPNFGGYARNLRNAFELATGAKAIIVKGFQRRGFTDIGCIFRTCSASYVSLRDGAGHRDVQNDMMFGEFPDFILGTTISLPRETADGGFEVQENFDAPVIDFKNTRITSTKTSYPRYDDFGSGITSEDVFGEWTEDWDSPNMDWYSCNTNGGTSSIQVGRIVEDELIANIDFYVPNDRVT